MDSVLTVELIGFFTIDNLVQFGDVSLMYLRDVGDNEISTDMYPRWRSSLNCDTKEQYKTTVYLLMCMSVCRCLSLTSYNG